MSRGAATQTEQPVEPCELDADAIMVALIMAPGTFSRNRFFTLYQDEGLWRARRRAQMVRSLIRELTEPWPLHGHLGSQPFAVVEFIEPVGDELLLRFSVPDMGYTRTAQLTAVEAAALKYCLHRAGRSTLEEQERQLVEACLHRLAPDLARGANNIIVPSTIAANIVAPSID